MRRRDVWLATAALVGMLTDPANALAGTMVRVQNGDSLWTIAGREIGDPTLWPALYLANRDRIKDPRRVYPGQELAVPSVDPAERAAVRREAKALLK